MKLTVFQSDKGDCLLVTAGDGTRVLVDGGMRSAYSEHVAAALAALREEGHRLDLVYVSHIDSDHISGVLQLVDDLVAWRVHDFQVGNGNPTHKVPPAPRPPEVRAIWHNAFHEQIGKNAGAVSDMLAATAGVLSGAQDLDLRAVAARHRELEQSVKEALQLSRRIGARQLGIPLNADFGGKLAMVRDGDGALALGGLEVFVLGPFESDLRKLRREWNDWLREKKEVLADIHRRARADEDLLGNEIAALIHPLLLEAKELGNRGKVTTPNLASLMLLLREDGRTVLLTGDGHAEDILKGLDHHTLRDPAGRLHLDVLKVQHHGSEHNIDEDFAGSITANHYVFCGNGAHENPDLAVVELIVQSRLNDGTNRPFKLWFNSSSTASGLPAHRAHMKEVEELVKDMKTDAHGRLQSFFLKDSSFELES